MSTYNEPPPRPFLKWVGGKRQLMPELLKAVAAAGSFRRYHEPFIGGGALFFALAHTEQLSRRSYLSDINQNLIDAYLGVRDDVQAVIAALTTHKRLHGEQYYYEIRASMPRKLARRAARIIYLNKTCYNGLYRENSKGRFNVPCGRYKNPNICDEENLRAVAKTLKGVDIEPRSFTAVLETSKRNDLVYFDPPYNPLSKTAGFTSYSREGFGAEAQVELAGVFDQLARRGVKVILSNSMTEFTKSLYADHYCYQVLGTRRVNSRADRRGKVPEALITSFPLTPEPHRSSRRLNGRSVQPILINGGLEKVFAKQWLVENNYHDVAALIDDVTEEWKAHGKKTRRNWWEILAGNTHGNPRIVASREFPVLRAAQLRQGVLVTDNALCRNPKEEIPSVRIAGRQIKPKGAKTTRETR